MTGAGQRVAIITGSSQGIGAGLVANSRTIKPSEVLSDQIQCDRTMSAPWRSRSHSETLSRLLAGPRT